jgi:pilus assembly protein CpaF
MRISDLIRQAQQERGADGSRPKSVNFNVDEVPEQPVSVDPVTAIKKRAQEALFTRLGSRLYDESIGRDGLDELVVQELDEIIRTEQIPLSDIERHQLVVDIKDNLLGMGPIEGYLKDPEITEIMVNGTESIFVERNGRLALSESRFLSNEHLRQLIERITAAVGRRIDESSPMVDARLPDGSRINAVIPPLSVDGPMLTIRKFRNEVLDIDQMIGIGTLDRRCAEFLGVCVAGRLSVLVTGGTGAGKTTMLNALSSFIPERERIVTIEDAVELRLRQRHVVRLESRPPNVEGRGEVTIRDLVRNALRMRPDRIIVGEVRGAESLDMLQAMNTGHEGSLGTLHANSARDALSRLETMVLMAGMELPVRAIREQIASAIDLIVHLARMSDGTRRIIAIDEVAGMEGDIITLVDLFSFDYSAGMDEHGNFLGNVEPTGLRPMFAERLEQQGIELPLRATSTEIDLRDALIK